ncbi:MAG: nickel-dependent lactate racemase [Clostridia bacterium]
MKVLMPYSSEKIEIDIENERIIDIIEQKKTSALKNPKEEIERSLKDPIDSESLLRLLHSEMPKKVVIVVNDITRPTPYKQILPTILTTIEKSGIPSDRVTILIATGIHRPNTHKENIESFGKEVVDNYKIVNHNSDENLKSIGTLSDGKELIINKIAADSDFLITTGQINLHYFAGYSGGRKSILPGIASRELITSNHARMNEPGCHSGSIEKNPIHTIMLEAALLARVRFTVNVVTNDRKEILSVFSGNIESAWKKGVEFCKMLSTARITRKAEVVIVSAGGFPKDINLYQAQKALEHAAMATKPGGTIVLFAACQEGYGEPKFKEWMDNTNNWEEIFKMFEKKFELGGHKAFALARALHNKTTLIITELNNDIINNCNLLKVNNIYEALEFIKSKYNDWNCYIMPQGSSVLPIIGE